MFIQFFIILILGLMYLLVVRPLIPLIKMKIKLGDKAVIQYFPIVGLFGIWTQSLKKEHDILKTQYDMLRQNPKIKVILTNLVHKPVALLVGSQYIKQIYHDHTLYDKEDPTNFEYIIYISSGLLTKGLAMTKGDLYQRQRKLLGNFFTFEKLILRVPMINQVVKQIFETDSKSNVNQFLARITGDVVLRSFFGGDTTMKFEGKDAQVAIVELFGEISFLPISNPYVLIKQMLFEHKSWNIFPIKMEKELQIRVQNLKQFFINIIQKRVTELQDQKIESNDNLLLIDLYIVEFLRQEQIQNKKLIDFEEIVQQFITFVFAGTETTSTTIATSLYYLALYPQDQQELLEEILDVVGDRDVQSCHLPKMIKTEAFVQEVLRLRNPSFVPIIRKTHSDTQLLDMKFTKGWFILLNLSASSQMENHVKNSDSFDFRRWITKQSAIQNDDGCIHVPFGIGTRSCIGQHMAHMETKIILAHILRKYVIQLNPNVQQIEFGIKFMYEVQPYNCVIFKDRI